MRFNNHIVKCVLKILSQKLIIIAAMAGLILLNGLDREGEGAEKLCDSELKYCVEQKCEIPFERVKKGVRSAYEFFENLGYVGKYHVDIELLPEVSVSMGEGAYRTKIRVLGKYEEDEKKIYMTCWGEAWLSERNDFNLDMTPDFYETIVTHEMIHFLSNRYTKNKIDNILSEYIAYSGQFEKIPKEAITKLIQKYKVEAFKETEINELILLEDPGMFGLKSFLHYKQTHASLIKEILNGKFKKPPNIWPPY